MTQTIPVHFGRGQNRILSNMARTPMTFRGVLFATAEGAYQAHKTGAFVSGFEHLAGLDAKRRANAMGMHRVSDDHAISLMREVLAQKYRQCPEFREALHAARGIITHPVGDAFWRAVFADLLTELRDRSREVRRSACGCMVEPVDIGARITACAAHEAGIMAVIFGHPVTDDQG